VLIYIVIHHSRSSCNLCTAACRSSTALYTMVVLRHVHGYTLVLLIIILAIKRKTYVRLQARFSNFALSSITFSRPEYKINSKTMVTSYIPYNLCCRFFAEHLTNLNMVKDLKPRCIARQLFKISFCFKIFKNFRILTIYIRYTSCKLNTTALRRQFPNA
jgi:hypothetical protein